MAVMTYKELKKRGLDHGEKWFGFVKKDLFTDVTLVIKIDFDCENNKCYPCKEAHILYENNGEPKVLYGELNYKFEYICNDIPNYLLFGDSIEELLEYAKTAPLLCPVDNKPTFGYKLLRTYPYGDFGLAFLEIPPDAKRTNPYFGRKCRADKVKVKAIWKLDKSGNLTEKVNSGYSPIQSSYLDYHVGEIIYSDFYDESRFVECTNGIHFYSTIGEVLELHQQQLLKKNIKEVLYHA